jgi:hypothetical protein
MNKEKDITNFDEHGNFHGFNQLHYSNGDVMFKIYFINGEESGYEERYPYGKGNTFIKSFHL